jgi:hypothetical protein
LNVESEQLDLLNEGIGQIAGLSLNSLISPQLSSRLLLGYYDDRNDIQVYDTFNYRYHANLNYHVSRISAKSELLYSPDDWVQFKTGAQLNANRADLLWNIKWRNELDMPDSITFFSRTVDNSAFWQVRLRAQKWLEYSAGIRYDYSSRYNEAHWQPRTRLLVNLTPRLSTWVSYGLYCQFPDFQTVISRGEPMNISGNIDYLEAELAEHAIVGVQWDSRPVRLKLEVYRKSFDHLLVNPQEAVFIPENSGAGRAQGVEVTMQKDRGSGRLGFWLSGAVSEARYNRFPGDEWEFFDYDQRFQGSAGLDWRLSRHWSVNTNYHYSSGFPYTPVLAVQRDLNESSGALEGWRVLKGDKNSARYSDYARLDVRLSYLYEKPGFNFSAYLDFINILNRRNVYMYDWRFIKNDGGNGYARRSIIYMLPFVPSFGISVGF